MKDIIIVAGVIMALITSISVFEGAVALFKLSNSLDKINKNLGNITTQISELRYALRGDLQDLNLSVKDVENTTANIYESMFTNANVTIIRDDYKSVLNDIVASEGRCCLEHNSK